MSLTAWPLAPRTAVSVTVTGPLYQPKPFGAGINLAVVKGGSFSGSGASSPGVLAGRATAPSAPIAPPLNLRLPQSSKPFRLFAPVSVTPLPLASDLVLLLTVGPSQSQSTLPLAAAYRTGRGLAVARPHM